MQKKEWYEEWFDEDYLNLYQKRNELEADIFLKTLSAKFSLEAGIRVVDLGCGSGRYAFPMAFEYNFDVTALDLSAVLLDVASERFSELESGDSNPSFVRGDLRCLPFCDACFDAGFSFFTSFGYFRSDDEHAATLREYRRVLKPGSLLIIDLFNTETALVGLGEEEIISHENKVFTIRKLHLPAEKRIQKQIAISSEQQDERTIVESVRYFTSIELIELAEASGFEAVTTFGDYDGNPYDSKNSTRMITCLRKK